MYRLTFTTDDQGGIVPTIQIRTTCRRPELVDADGWPARDAPGPHAHGPIPFAPINRRPVRAEELQP